MILKLGFKELLRNFFINMLCIIQLSIIFVTLLAMVTSVLSRFEKYSPFSAELNSKGVFLNVDTMLINKKYTVIDESDIIDKIGLVKVESITALKNVWVKEEISVRAYSESLVERYTPKLEDGEWLSSNVDLPKDTIKGVISDNYDNVSIGDIFEISEAFSGEKIKIFVVGKINRNSSIIGFSDSNNGKFSFENLYQHYDIGFEEKPLLLINAEELKETGVPFTTQIKDSLIITYSDDITAEEEKSNYQKLMSGNLIVGYSTLEEMNSNSKHYIYEELNKLLPMIISIFSLASLSILGTTAINVKTQIRTFSIFYICGMKWTHILLIECIKSMIMVLIALFTALFICVLSGDSFWGDGLILEFGKIQICCCSLFALIFVLLSVIFPKIIIKNEKPVAIFHYN